MSKDHHQAKITFTDLELARQLFGEHNCHLQQIARSLSLDIKARGNSIHIKGDIITAKLDPTIMTQL